MERNLPYWKRYKISLNKETNKIGSMENIFPAGGECCAEAFSALIHLLLFIYL